MFLSVYICIFGFMVMSKAVISVNAISAAKHNITTVDGRIHDNKELSGLSAHTGVRRNHVPPRRTHNQRGYCS